MKKHDSLFGLGLAIIVVTCIILFLTGSMIFITIGLIGLLLVFISFLSSNKDNWRIQASKVKIYKGTQEDKRG